MCVEGEALSLVGVPEGAWDCSHHERMAPARERAGQRGGKSESQAPRVLSSPWTQPCLKLALPWAFQ